METLLTGSVENSLIFFDGDWGIATKTLRHKGMIRKILRFTVWNPVLHSQMATQTISIALCLSVFVAKYRNLIQRSFKCFQGHLLSIVHGIRTKVNPFSQVDVTAVIADGQIQRQVPMTENIKIMMSCFLKVLAIG